MMHVIIEGESLISFHKYHVYVYNIFTADINEWKKDSGGFDFSLLHVPHVYFLRPCTNIMIHQNLILPEERSLIFI